MPDRDDAFVRQEQRPQVISEPKPPFPKQRQNHPGLESRLDPRPRYKAENYRPAGKLTGKVTLITGGDFGIGRAVALMYAREGADVAIGYLPDEQSDADCDGGPATPAGGDAVIATASEDALGGSPEMIDYAASKAAMVAFTKSISVHLAKKGVRANVVVPGPTWTPLNVADQGYPEEEIRDMGTATELRRPAQPEEIAPTYVFLASDADSSFITGEVIAATGGMATTR